MSADKEAIVPQPPATFNLNSAPARQPNRFFFGRFGLRAGYGISLVVLAWALLATVAAFAAFAADGVLPAVLHAQAYAKAHPGGPKLHVNVPLRPTLTIVQDAVILLGLLGLYWLLSRRERRRLAVYGLARYRFADIFAGAAWGVVVLSALVATLHAMHLLVFDGRALFGAAALAYGLKWLFAFLLVGLSEEYFFRGYIQYAFVRGSWGLAERISPFHVRGLAFAIATLFTSLLFGITHSMNSGENFFGLVQIVFAGVAFAYPLWRTGSLWWGVGFHMAWDWAQSFLFGVADSGQVSVGRLFITHPQGRPLLSGGTDGPEGSIFATVALLLMVGIVRLTTRPGIQPALEQGAAPEPSRSLLHNSVA